MKPQVCLAGLAFLLSSSMAIADQPARILDTLPLDYVRRVQALQNALASGGDAEAARSVYYGGAVWPISYRQLNVCFFGGTSEARTLIAEAAGDWMRPGVAIALDFGEPGRFRNCGENPETEMQIRIAFEDQGWWSAIGSDSVISLAQDQHSMNLAEFGTMTRDKWSDIESLIVRHEFGHALALMHEHQSPKAPCEEEYNWDKIYEVLGGPPSNWPKEIVDFNMRRLDAKHFPATAFDRKSIMIYQFGAEFYKTGAMAECFIAAPNVAPSESDRSEILALYPQEESERIARATKARQEFQILWNKADPALKNTVGFDPITVYFDRKPD